MNKKYLEYLLGNSSSTLVDTGVPNSYLYEIPDHPLYPAGDYHYHENHFIWIIENIEECSISTTGNFQPRRRDSATAELILETGKGWPFHGSMSFWISLDDKVDVDGLMEAKIELTVIGESSDWINCENGIHKFKFNCSNETAPSKPVMVIPSLQLKDPDKSIDNVTSILITFRKPLRAIQKAKVARCRARRNVHKNMAVTARSSSNIMLNPVKEELVNQTIYDEKESSGDVEIHTLMDGMLVEKIMAHKSILAGKSKIFEAILESKIPQNGLFRIEIIDIEPEVIHEILKYLYLGETKVKFGGWARDFLEFANTYEIPELAVKCLEYMAQNILQYKWNALFEIISERGKEHLMLKNEVKKYFQENQDSLKEDPEFHEAIKAFPNVFVDIYFP